MTDRANPPPTAPFRDYDVSGRPCSGVGDRITHVGVLIGGVWYPRPVKEPTP